MKKFETVTELEILNAAYSCYLSKWYNEICILKKNSNDFIAKAREPKLRKICDELRAEIIKLENQ